MRIIKHCYSTETKWIDVLAEAMGGTVSGNFIKGNNEIYTGTHYVLPMEDRIAAMVIDTTYKETVLLKYKNDKDSFVGLYFYITNHNVDFILDNEAAVVGKSDYNFTIIDSVLETDYAVVKGTGIYVICIFIDKVALKEYMDKMPSLRTVSQDVFNAEKNTIISMGRMNIESYLLINDFRKIPYENPLFELYFKGLVYKLIGNYLDQLLSKKFIISKVIHDDLKSIIASKALLLESIDGVFPGVEFLAEQVFMSPSKYKKLFTKISGLSPGAFFYGNKLERAKELLGTGQYTVSEVSEKLNYANISYLAKRFNDKYGIFPKEYQSLL
ncbi:helix-turn-helix transcriptional regulator [Flavobacterium sp. PL02]|uniref:helix-turn-helix transcriptional regulator n=1 Tax=Flavobacterium sp. PL02 TaxID=3088354 RepID=UPI002B236730|nr:helix-turn-helix transcriptional regulator [Flavobacterium sp. PL02]MEA9414236.1 helix-turn-helix transcriptional regulator [Flavobacterium sp. PL02]